jgi:Ala-tRNA(Pro) deacylase
MPAAKLKQFLDSHNIKYVTISHSVAYTAQEIAAITHIPGKTLAKTIMVHIDGRLAMAVVPASLRLSLSRLKRATNAGVVEIATEQEFRNAFPDCETGAMPPFGNLYSMPVFIDEALQRDEIVFNAGSHRELIKMSYRDFDRLVEPKVGHLATEVHELAARF